jgi:hypothetical protein
MFMDAGDNDDLPKDVVRQIVAAILSNDVEPHGSRPQGIMDKFEEIRDELEVRDNTKDKGASD